MNGRYEIRKGNGFHGQWEVAHHWDEGCTVQTRYFKTRNEARKYVAEKTGNILDKSRKSAIIQP